MKTVTNLPNLKLAKHNNKISSLVSPAHLRTSLFMSNKKFANFGKFRWYFKNF